MKIKSLELTNFKQFYGNQIVDISTSSDKNVTVFRGVNGTGKTSLFTAINWCLYGIGHEGMGEIVNKQIVADAKDNDEVEANVKVRFSDKSYDFVAERSLVFQKLDGRLINEKQNFYLFQIDKQGQTTKIPNPEGKMDSILPKNVREYFFFNGEKMDDLTRPGNTKIEDAIKNIMHLPIIDKAVVHLSSITKEYRSEISKIATDRLEKLIKEQDNLEKEIEKLRKDNENIDNEIIKDETQIKDLEKILADSKEVGQLQLRRKQLQDDLFILENERDSAEDKVQETLKTCYPFFLASRAKKALEIINNQVEKGKIPSGIRKQFIEGLLSNGECICGRPIEVQTPAYYAMIKLLSSSQSSQFEDSILDLRGNIQTINDLTSERLAKLHDYAKQYFSKVKMIEVKEREIDDLNRRIGSSEEIDIRKLEARLQSFRNDKDNLNYQKGKNISKIEEKQSTIENIIKQREEEEIKQENLIKLSAREKLANKSHVAIVDIREKFYEATRSRIESETKKVFNNLAWKTDQFNDINLDKDFHFEVIDRWGKPSREELSAGERQILSLSFITAISRLSGEEAPIIMDTPFARLSKNHLETTTATLPNLLPQLILFVTDTEWTSEVQKGLSERIGYKYLLDFHNGCTTIKKEYNG